MVRLLLFTDEPVLVKGLEVMLEAAPTLDLDAVSENLHGLADAIEQRRPDLLLMDFTAEEHFATLLELRNRVPQCKIVLWVHRISIEVAYQVMKLGVRGILRKTLGTDLFVKCLEKVAEGDLWFDKELTAGFLGAKTVALTPRESQLVMLVSQGLKNKEIATVLNISEATVRIYLSTLFRKLNVKDRYELAIYGMKNLPGKQTSLEQASEQRYFVMEPSKPQPRGVAVMKAAL